MDIFRNPSNLSLPLNPKINRPQTTRDISSVALSAGFRGRGAVRLMSLNCITFPRTNLDPVSSATPTSDLWKNWGQRRFNWRLSRFGFVGRPLEFREHYIQLPAAELRSP